MSPASPASQEPVKRATVRHGEAEKEKRERGKGAEALDGDGVFTPLRSKG